MPNNRKFKSPSAVGLSWGAEGGSVTELQEFLRRFGYLHVPPDGEPFAAVRALSAAPKVKEGVFDENTAAALSNYQRFHRLPITGRLDDATVAHMSMPRCGFPDIPHASGSSEFVAQGNSWPQTNLTFSFQNSSPDLTQQEVRNAVVAALGLWSQVTPLTFTEVAANPDIVIRFVAGDHGDGNPFDGVGNVLAHAFFPPPNGGAIAGDAHFDEAETWTVNIPATGRDLMTVAAHEFGHSLGLNHTPVAGALMEAIYNGPHRFLAADDISGIQSIYGPRLIGRPQLVVQTFGYDAGGWRVDRHPRFLADVTGDGRPDIVGFGDAGVWTAHNNGDGTFQAPQMVIANFAYSAGGWRVDKHPRFAVDVTGDGRADVVGFGDAGVWVSRNNGDGTFQAPQMVIANFAYSAGGWRVDMHPRFLADTTGDGRADIVGFGNAGVWVSRNNGNGTFRAPQLVIGNFGYNAGGWRVDRHPRFVVDVTGDGRADIVGFGDDGVWVAQNNGNGTFQPPQMVVANFAYNAGGWRVDRHPRFLADVTGDGRPDIVGFGDAGVWVSRNNGNGTFQAP